MYYHKNLNELSMNYFTSFSQLLFPFGRVKILFFVSISRFFCKSFMTDFISEYKNKNFLCTAIILNDDKLQVKFSLFSMLLSNNPHCRCLSKPEKGKTWSTICVCTHIRLKNFLDYYPKKMKMKSVRACMFFAPPQNCSFLDKQWEKPQSHDPFRLSWIYFVHSHVAISLLTLIS